MKMKETPFLSAARWPSRNYDHTCWNLTNTFRRSLTAVLNKRNISISRIKRWRAIKGVKLWLKPPVSESLLIQLFYYRSVVCPVVHLRLCHSEWWNLRLLIDYTKGMYICPNLQWPKSSAAEPKRKIKSNLKEIQYNTTIQYIEYL